MVPSGASRAYDPTFMLHAPAASMGCTTNGPFPDQSCIGLRLLAPAVWQYAQGVAGVKIWAEMGVETGMGEACGTLQRTSLARTAEGDRRLSDIAKFHKIAGMTQMLQA